MSKFASRPNKPAPPPVVQPVKRQGLKVAQSEIKRRQSSKNVSGGVSQDTVASNTVFTPGTQGVGDSSLDTGNKTLLGG